MRKMVLGESPRPNKKRIRNQGLKKSLFPNKKARLKIDFVKVGCFTKVNIFLAGIKL